MGTDLWCQRYGWHRTQTRASRGGALGLPGAMPPQENFRTCMLCKIALRFESHYTIVSAI